MATESNTTHSNPSWLQHSDKDPATARAAGATVISNATEVPGVGGMATIADRYGARLALIDYLEARHRLLSVSSLCVSSGE